MKQHDFSSPEYLARLAPPTGRVRVFLDTDMANEVDDPFALAHLALSPDRVDLVGVGIAPYRHAHEPDLTANLAKSRTMTESALSLCRVEVPVHDGSTRLLGSVSDCVESPAAQAIVEAAHASDELLYVIGIGAATDLASALALDPSIAERCVLVWLGGHAPWSGEAREYNLEGDPDAARAIFRSPIPMVLAPAIGVTSQLLISPHALNAEIGDCPGLGEWLAKLVWDYHEDRFAWEKEMWDMGATAWCIDPSWIWTVIGGPWDIDANLKWVAAPGGKPIQTMFWIKRNEMFRDLFSKIRSL